MHINPPDQVTSLVDASEVQALLQALTRCLGKTKTWEDRGQTPTQDPAVRRGEARAPPRGLLQAPAPAKVGRIPSARLLSSATTLALPKQAMK